MRAKVCFAILLGLMLTQSGCFRFGFGCGCTKLVDDSAVSCSGQPVTIDVLANDKLDANATIKSVTILAAPDVAQGTAAVNADNTVTFTPVLDATGEATFTYQVCTEQTSWCRTKTCCKSAQVTVFLRATGETAPTATGDTATTEQTNAAGILIDVLANDTNPNSALPGGDTLTISNLTQPTNGTAAVESTPTGQQVRYIPNGTFAGDDTFTYEATDGCGDLSGPATVTVTVTAPPAVPVSEPAAAASRVAATAEAAATTAEAAPAQAVVVPPALVLIVNNSKFEVTVYAGSAQVDVVQPLGATVAPASVASGKSQTIRVDALLPKRSRARVTTATANLDPDGRYTITYTDDNKNEAIVNVSATR